MEKQIYTIYHCVISNEIQRKFLLEILDIEYQCAICIKKTNK